MRTHSTAGIVLALGCAWLLGAGGAAAAPLQRDSTDRAAVLQTFTAAVERYAALRARFEEPLPPFDPRRGEWALRVQRHYLASAVRRARPRAALGDIFSPMVAALFEQDIASAIATHGIGDWLEQRLGPQLVDLTVNEPIPEWALRPVPIELLRILPPLTPAGIEYRFVANALILWDTHADILIDALPGALTWDD